METLKLLFATPLGAIAQCVGFVAMGVALFIFSFHSRKRILVFKMLADLLWVAHYFLLGAYSGAVINAVNAVREGVFYNKGKRWASSWLCPALFVAVGALLTLSSWQGWISLLPLFGSAINSIALWSSSAKRLRLLVLPSQTLWLIYSICVGSLPSVIFNSFSLLSAVYGLVRGKGKRE